MLMETSAFDVWATQAQLPNSQPLQDIGHETEGPIIAIDAVYFLEELQLTQRGSLAPVLGAFPRSAESFVAQYIKDLQSVGCKVFFFFNGMNTVFDAGLPAATSIANVKHPQRSNSRSGVKDKSINDQFASGGPDNDWYCSCLKMILQAHGIPYVVAPFKAHAQMVYALQSGAVDALYGPSDLFLYGAPKVITKIRLQHDHTNPNGTNSNQLEQLSFKPDQSKIVWLELDQCLKMLGDIPLELFQDAMYLVGNRSLDPFPPLRDSLDPQVSLPFKEVVASLNQIGGNILQFCERYPPAIRGNWLDRYMRAHQAIKHMVIAFEYGTVKPRTYQNSQRVDRPPSDIHELIGLQLPAELYHYLYHGMLNTRVLNWLISGKIKLSPPLMGEDSEAYRKLARQQLDPWRKQVLALLAYILSHYWQRKDIVTQTWYGPENDQKFNIRDLSSEKSRISTWRVKKPLLSDRFKALEKSHKSIKLGSLQFAVLSLADPDFTAKTVSPAKRSGTESPLQDSEEITCNVIWRMLQLRGYTTEKHELTAWGKFLKAALEASPMSSDAAQSMFVIVELTRLGLLNQAQKGFEEQIPLSGLNTPSDRSTAALVLYLACAGNDSVLENQQRKGPSNAHLLTYHALTSEIRLALRDLIDVVLATMFLDDEVERARDDVLDISSSLPFQARWSAGLAVAVAHSLETLSSVKDEDEKKSRHALLQQKDISDPIKATGDLCDAFEAAVQKSPSDLIPSETRTLWSKAYSWFDGIRQP